MRPRELACFAFVLAWAAYSAAAPVADNDLWGHVLFGRQILASGALPSTNGYAYTAANHPWINHEILAECLFAFIYDALGSTGLLAFKIALGVLIVLIMRETVRRQATEPLAWALALGLAASVMSWGFLIRPQLFTLLGTSLLWNRLHADAAGSSRWTLLSLPPLFAFWINTHGGVLAGYAILTTYCVFEGLREQAFRRRLVLLVLVCGLTLSLNPYGPRLVSFLLLDVGLSRRISEWAPIVVFDASHLPFKLAVALTVVGIANCRVQPIWECTIVAVAALAAFQHQRHAPLFAILAAPLLARTLSDTLGDLRNRQPVRLAPLFASLPVLLLGIAGWQTWQVAGVYRALHGQIFVSPEVFPVDAVRFIYRNQLTGNLLVPFDWGEYALWHLHTRCRVSVDGRYTTAYPLSVLEQSDRFLTGAPGWRDSLGAATITVVDRRQPIIQAMFAEPGWQYAYSDATALVFVRKDAVPAREWVRDARPAGAFFFP